MRLFCTVVLVLVGCTPADNAAPDAGQTDMRIETNSVDDVDFSCQDPGWTPGPCAAGVTTELLPRGAEHVSLPTPIEYEDIPPANGSHRGEWARWGEYEYLPPQRWVHNLEHGGIAFLYHPCADAELVDELREFARSRPEDAGGDFRWVMTPFPELPTAVAAVSWNWTYEAECVDRADMDQFTANHYRRAPEDVRGDGAFDDRWIGK